MKLKELRNEIGISQEVLAKALNTTQRNVSNWENGDSEPDFEMLTLLADYFCVSIDYLVRGENFEKIDSNNITSLDKQLIKKVIALSNDKKQALLKILELG